MRLIDADELKKRTVKVGFPTRRNAASLMRL